MNLLDTLRSMVSVSRISRGFRVTSALSDLPSLEVVCKPLRQIGLKATVQGREFCLRLHLPGLSVYANAFGPEFIAERVAARNGWPAYGMVAWGAQAYYDPDARHHVVTYAWEHHEHDSQYTSRDPSRHGYHALEDFLFGPVKVTRKTLWRGPVSVPMPEGSYAGTGSLVRVRHWRARWPGPWAVFYRENVDLPQGIEFPDDVSYGLSIGRDYRGENGAHGAVGAVVSDVLGERGSAAWRPRRRVRRALPLSSGAWEARDPLTGRWARLSGVTSRSEAARLGRIDEPPCGCCGAKYGQKCTDKACPNVRLRGENVSARRSS